MLDSFHICPVPRPSPAQVRLHFSTVMYLNPLPDPSVFETVEPREKPMRKHERAGRFGVAVALVAMLLAASPWAAATEGPVDEETGSVGSVPASGTTPNIGTTPRSIDEDSVSVASAGFDFGGGTYVWGGLTESGHVDWLIDTNKFTPQLTGELHLDNVIGQCARMRIDYYSATGVSLRSEYGGSACAVDNTHGSWTVDLAPWTSDKIGSVTIALEHRLDNGTWVTLGTDSSTPETFVDDTILMASYGVTGTKGFDFGDDYWDPLRPAPMGGGEVEWSISGGQITPRLNGVLYLKNQAGTCARMKIEYYANDGPDGDVFPDFLEVGHGGTVCAVDNSRHEWTVDLAPYHNSAINNVEIFIESLQSNGSWLEVDSAYSTFG